MVTFDYVLMSSINIIATFIELELWENYNRSAMGEVRMLDCDYWSHYELKYTTIIFQLNKQS